MKRHPNSGLALIVVVGVLGVLSVLAVAFVTMAQLERKASVQRVYAARAYLLARSGIEDAQARLGMGQDPAYGGEDWNGNGTLDAGVETDAQVFQPGVLNIADCPVRYALRASFFAVNRASPGAPPALIGIDGSPRGYTGRLSDDFAPGGDHWALKDQGEGFYVNGGDPVRQTVPGPPPLPRTDYNDVLKRILGVLADALNHDGNPVSQADGWALIDQRPQTGWQSFDQIRDLALGGSQAKLNALQPYLVLQAWTDKRVVRSNVDATMTGRPYPTWADIKLDHGLNHFVAPDNTSHAPDFERDRAGRIIGRAPVDLAWARTRRPALIALLANLKGLYLDEGQGGATTISPPPLTITWVVDHWVRTYPPADMVGVLRSGEITLDWGKPTDDCRGTVAAIMASPSALSTWQQWNDFCDTLTSNVLSLPTGSTDLQLLKAKRDILKANFNPNSDLNKFNPNPSLWRAVDKSDLLAYSTEFSLFSVQPRRMSSIGRVLGAQGRLLASRTLTATVGGPSVVRLSTQREFVCGDLGNLDLPGDETGLRLPGQTPYITPNGGPDASWSNLSLQSYPEPYVDPGGGLGISPADYDGSLQLATLQTPRNDYYGVTGTPAADMKMLATFTSGFDLDVAEAFPANPNGSRNQPDALQVPTSLLAAGGLQETSPGSRVVNTLYPDGGYSEKGRAPAWFDKNNAHGIHGILSFWMKPAWTYYPGNEPYYRGHEYVKWTNFADPSSNLINSANQFFFLGDAHSPYPPDVPWAQSYRNIALYLEDGRLAESNGGIDTDGPHAHMFQTPDRTLTPRRWYLLTVYYDFGSGSVNKCGKVLVDAGAAGADQAETDVYNSAADGTSPSDITLDDRFGSHKIVLGTRGPLEANLDEWIGSGSDATFDEFAIYDFGGHHSGTVSGYTATLAAPGILAANRYNIGRYYRESVYANDPLHPDHWPGDPGLFPGNNAAQWLSAPITLGPGTIQGLAWTQIVPPGLPDGRIVFDLADASGRAVNTLFTQDALSPVGRAVNAPFRLHAIFQPNLPSTPPATPILDPLALDDVTLLYQPGDGPRVASWQEGE